MTTKHPELVSQQTPITDLIPHPRNYRSHPDDQIEHLMASIREHGFYRNVVAARGGVILAGHGVTLAAVRLGLENVPTIHLDIDPESVQALKILAADNFVWHLAEDDDRLLTEMLKEIQSVDDLLGTGFDELSLAALTMVTRSASEIEDFDAAAEWAGMPEFSSHPERPCLKVEFETAEEREEFVRRTGLFVTYRTSKILWSARMDDAGRADVSSVQFEG